MHGSAFCCSLQSTGCDMRGQIHKACMQFSVDCDVHSVLQQVSFAEVACYILM